MCKTQIKNICVITGTRAEYGLLYWLMKEIKADRELNLKVIATGMHLSPEFGMTYKQIEDDGFKIHKKIEMLLSSDTPIGISKSMGLGIIGFAEAFTDIKPDIVIILGDRFEIFSAASAAMVACIPIAHIHGGERSEGAFDEAIRHAITKMSHLHFTATEEYARRIIQLGESPDRVFNVGALGMDNIKKLKLMSKTEFENSIGFKLGRKNLLITFHPVTFEYLTAEKQFRALLNAIDGLKDTKFIFTKPNADSGGRIIAKMIDDYVRNNNNRAIAFTNLGQLRYLSALKFVNACVGNSSSGIIEAPAFKIGTINIGDRQKGRIRANSVIDCAPDRNSILNAIKKLYSDEFQANLKNSDNPYGEGRTAEKIKKIIKEIDCSNILKKSFHDLPFHI